jgi:hypothetical protein
MIMTNKIVAVALVTALIGASLGAAIMHSRDTAPSADTAVTMPDSSGATSNNGADMRYTAATSTRGPRVPSEFTTTEQQDAYKIGFADGFQAAGAGKGISVSESGVVPQSRIIARNTTVRSNATTSRRAYYDYSQPRGRSFWSKHRDKLTLAMGTGGGALLGGLIGGKKGAGIGSLAGLGGSALYTYKLRKRSHR